MTTDNYDPDGIHVISALDVADSNENVVRVKLYIFPLPKYIAKALSDHLTKAAGEFLSDNQISEGEPISLMPPEGTPSNEIL